MSIDLGELPSPKELLELYSAVGWTAYTDEPQRLVDAVRNSTWVLTARDGRGALLGLARVISDQMSIAYIQDLLVMPESQRSGVGGALLDAVIEQCAGIRQVVLMTDAEPGQRQFYESRAFREIHDLDPTPLRSFVRLS
ncbi:GNAT family N-acetyltransferase [Curtobacterium sp. MCPF17_002]|uniref:GNAT family N-acetyltransferase n=1 Tax=Curtobacterium sp. MCPF17_002 TaxID=2175645 RepID=UPI000DA8EA99|nr:GNAT family N-acetyltransferase [Curtobacterium sp. MCPF17_002]WIB76688.1 GNAT family N-acetyltransferase [Curtobacterium sp. MCPF17_002]